MIEALELGYYENPLWLKMIEKFRGRLLAMAITYILCFVCVTFLIVFLEIDLTATLEVMFYAGFWFFAASILIALIGGILRSSDRAHAKGGAFQGRKRSSKVVIFEGATQYTC